MDSLVMDGLTDHKQQCDSAVSASDVVIVAAEGGVTPRTDTAALRPSVPLFVRMRASTSAGAVAVNAHAEEER